MQGQAFIGGILCLGIFGPLLTLGAIDLNSDSNTPQAIAYTTIGAAGVLTSLCCFACICSAPSAEHADNDNNNDSTALLGIDNEPRRQNGAATTMLSAATQTGSFSSGEGTDSEQENSVLDPEEFQALGSQP